MMVNMSRVHRGGEHRDLVAISLQAGKYHPKGPPFITENLAYSNEVHETKDLIGGVVATIGGFGASRAVCTAV